MEKKEYAVSYYGGHVSAWLCVVVAIAGIMFMLQMMDLILTSTPRKQTPYV